VGDNEMTSEQQKTLSELAQYEKRLRQAQAALNRTRQVMERQARTVSELVGVVKYLRAQLPSKDEVQALREPKQ